MGTRDIKLLGREADHSHPFSDEFKNGKLYLNSPLRLQSLMLIKHRDNFTFPPLLPDFKLGVKSEQGFPWKESF
jgi:hypothetical protein